MPGNIDWLPRKVKPHTLRDLIIGAVAVGALLFIWGAKHGYAGDWGRRLVAPLYEEATSIHGR